MYSRPTSRSDKKSFSKLKLLWYALATVLVLSLPTFSLVVPRQDYLENAPSQAPVEKAKVKRSSYNPQELSSGPTRWASSMPDSSIWGRSSRGRSVRGSSPTRRTFPRDATRTPSARQARSRQSQRPPAQEPTVQAERQNAEIGDQPEPLNPVEASEILEALAELQQDYDYAYENTFQGGLARNPFLGALNRNYGGGGTSDGNSDGNNNGNSNPPPSGGDGGEGGSPGDTGGGSKPNVDVVEPPPGQEYSFLIVGHFVTGSSQPYVARAWRDEGYFFLDNFTRFSFFPGFVHAVLIFKESDRLLICDLNRDGRQDFVVARSVANLGTAVESYINNGMSFQLHASTVFYLQTVRSLSAFDFDGDGGQELAILTEGRNRLWILKEINREWRYLREMVLPITPGFLFRSGLETGFETSFLYVADANGEELVSITPEQPGSFRLGSQLPPGVLQKMEVTLRPGAGLETYVLDLPDLILVLERRNGVLVPAVNADLTRGVPTLIIGDYEGAGNRQILWVP